MGFEAGELEIKGEDDKICHSDRHCFVVDLNINRNSGITLQRNFSRKGSVRGGEKNFCPTTADLRNAAVVPTSPTAILHGGSTSEKPVVVTLSTTSHSGDPKLHHPITIKNGGLSSPAAECERRGSRFGFRFRPSPPNWYADPKRILMIFATLSTLGTILLIYFTLSIGKLDGEDNDVY